MDDSLYSVVNKQDQIIKQLENECARLRQALIDQRISFLPTCNDREIASYVAELEELRSVTTERDARIAELEARIKASQEQEPIFYACEWPHSGGDNYEGGVDEILINRNDAESEKDYQVAVENGFKLSPLYLSPYYAAPVIKEQP